MDVKRCRHCGVTKTVDQFGPGQRMRDGLHSWCRACVNERAKEYRDDQTEEQKDRRRETKRTWQKKDRLDHPERHAGYSRKHRLGVPRDIWEKQYQRQGGVCAIAGCGRPATDTDHDHHCDTCTDPKRACGRCFRGILCRKCNLMLTARVTPDLLRAAADYLEGEYIPFIWYDRKSS